MTVVMAAALAAPASAAAAPAWLGSSTLFKGSRAEAPQVAMTPSGDATAVWVGAEQGEPVIEASERPAGGAWSAPQTLSDPLADSEEPDLAVDPEGDAIVLWQSSREASQPAIESSFRAAGGSWSGSQKISRPDTSDYAPSVGFDSHGNAVAIWESIDGTEYPIESATRPRNGGWSAVANVSDDGMVDEQPDLAVDSVGNAVAVWRALEEGGQYIAEASARPAGGSWSGSKAISLKTTEMAAPGVAIDANGDALATYDYKSGLNYTVAVAERPLGSGWSMGAAVTPESGEFVEPEIAVGSGDAAVATWTQVLAAGRVVEVIDRPAGGSWSAAARLTEDGRTAYGPVAAVDAAGGSLLAWLGQAGSSSSYAISGSARAPGGSWSSAVSLSPTGIQPGGPALAGDSEGDGVAVWTGSEEGEYFTQAAGYDGAGPQLRGFSIAANAGAGRPVSLGVSPLDVWSPLGAAEWSFGDGKGASGDDVSHVYRRAGTYPVSVTSTDSLGNASTATGSIRISWGLAKAGRAARVKEGHVLLQLTCTRADCNGRLALAVRRRRKGRHGVGRQARPKKAATMKVASGTFSIAVGKRKVVRLKLNRRGAALLAARGRRSLKTRVSGLRIRSGAVSLRAAAAKPRHGR
jgi:hypothetical protein